MAEVKSVIKDMSKQRVIQGVTGLIALISLGVWFMGQWWGVYPAAGAIILFAVATLHWIDDEEVIEKEHCGQAVKK